MQSFDTYRKLEGKLGLWYAPATARGVNVKARVDPSFRSPQLVCGWKASYSGLTCPRTKGTRHAPRQ